MIHPAVLSLLLSLVVALPAGAAEKLAVRAANGRFLHVCDDGVLRAESSLPLDRETFDLASVGKDEIAIKGPGGRYLVSDRKDARVLRLGTAIADPGDRETCRLVPVEGQRFAIWPRGYSIPPLSKPGATLPFNGAKADTMEVYRVRPLPDLLQTAVSVTVQALTTQELTGKQYDKTGTHETNKYVNVPTPTLMDPKRKIRVQVLGVTEEYRVEAQLDGKPDIRIPAMLYLANYAEGGPGLILVAIDARLPIIGHVHGKVPDVVSASTGYHATIQLSATVEIRVQRSGNGVTCGPYAVSDLHVSFSRLEFSDMTYWTSPVV